MSTGRTREQGRRPDLSGRVRPTAPSSGHVSGVITTDDRFKNFIDNQDEWFSDIEHRALDLETELSEWRESRARELAEPARRREFLRATGNPQLRCPDAA